MIIFVYGGKLKIEKSYLQVMNRFRKWLADSHEEVHLPENMEPPQLNRYIRLFLLSLKRLDGNDMEPDLITSYHRAIDRNREKFNLKYMNVVVDTVKVHENCT